MVVPVGIVWAWDPPRLFHAQVTWDTHIHPPTSGKTVGLVKWLRCITAVEPEPEQVAFLPQGSKTRVAVEGNTGTSQQEVQVWCYMVGKTQSREEPSVSPGGTGATGLWGCCRRIPRVLRRHIPGKRSCQDFREISPSTFFPGIELFCSLGKTNADTSPT